MSELKRIKTRNLSEWILFTIVSIITWFQLELSSNYDTFWGCFGIEQKYIILNILTNGALIIILYIVLNRMWSACLFFSSTVTVVALVNYYIIKFKGMPLSVMELGNFMTALNVIGNYTIRIDRYTLSILLLYLGCFILCLITMKITRTQSFVLRKVLLRDLILLGMCAMFVYIGYVSPNAVKPKSTISWSWIEAYHTYGYMACSLEMFYQTHNIITRPDGYSLETLQDVDVTKKDRQVVISSPFPDIILILNECFYDLAQAASITTDIPYLENIDRMKNTDKIVSGNAVVPYVGGGTNSTEYEMLTSNSLQLMVEGITPFNVLEMKNANSIVSHLKQLGYVTLGSHSEPALNYSRGRAYPDLGFDIVYFNDDFVDKEYYGRREYETDESLYKNIVAWYNEMPEQSPRFLYLLTIQNHGGWDMNPPESDTVHVFEDYGEHTQEVNEYLSSIRLSDIAFKDLTDYFLSVDRPVIICMVGDHAPMFVNDIADADYTESERGLKLRSTPFIIWSNYNIEKTVPELISINYLLPLVLDVAEVNMSPYYEYMLALSEKVPILTSHGVYWDYNGNEYVYTSETDYTDEINRYFYLEYNNLSQERIQYFFDAYN